METCVRNKIALNSWWRWFVTFETPYCSNVSVKGLWIVPGYYPENQLSPLNANSLERRLNQLAANAVQWRHFLQPDSDFDLLIIRTFAWLFLIMRNLIYQNCHYSQSSSETSHLICSGLHALWIKIENENLIADCIKISRLGWTELLFLLFN